MLKIFKKKWALAVVIVVVLVAGYFLFLKKSTVTTYAIATASRGTIVSYVSGTGQVSGENQVNITPLASGKVTAVEVKQGDYVKAGQVIAVLDESAASSSVGQAKAALASAEANYEKLIAGPTSLQVQASQLSVDSAENSLNHEYVSLYNDLNSVYTTVWSSVHNTTDSLFNNPNTSLPTLIYSTNDMQSQINAQNDRAAVNSDLAAWQSELQALSPTATSSAFDAEAQASLNHLSAIKTFFLDLENSLVNAIASPSFSATTIASDRSSVASAVTSVEGNISTVISDMQSIQSGKNSLASAENSLAQLTAPPTDADIKAAQASVLNAEASVQNAQTNYNNNIITAPFSGEVAILNIQVGDLITGSTVAGTTGSTEIGTIVANQKIAEVTLNEADVANIKIGDLATVTFDALPDLTVVGKVAEIDNVGTVTQGVVNYNVKISLETQDPSIRAGMSVTANIVTGVHQNVLVVPNAAVKSQGSISYVETLDKSTITPAAAESSLVVSSAAPKETVVQTGAADDSNTEVTNGLSEGDIVVTQTNSSSASTVSATQAGGAGRFGGPGGGIFRIGG
ncbi:biotin/lipoyl-binding protein [Patescibacteria group bacterium]|nr:biotin/lipoyl-binding protein [Patescibacteria group bacterium]MCL5114619.1 biotin/lipoyl-binding protein [Patescibacteria group bacterium]